MQAVFLLHSVALLLQPSRARAEPSWRIYQGGIFSTLVALARPRVLLPMIPLWIMSEGVARARVLLNEFSTPPPGWGLEGQ